MFLSNVKTYVDEKLCIHIKITFLDIVYHFSTMAKWLTDCLIEVTCVFIGAKTIEPGVIYSKVVG